MLPTMNHAAVSTRMLLFALASILIAAPCAATADDDASLPPIEELFKTQLVFPQDAGEIQLATFPGYRDGPEGTAFVLPLSMEYGITDALQLEAEWDAFIDADASDPEESGSGQGNLQLGLMYSVMDIRDSGFHFAAAAEYEFASGDRKFLEGGNRNDSWEVYLIFAKDLEEASRSQLFLQVGVELQGSGYRPASLELTDPGTVNGIDLDNGDERSADDDETTRHDPNVWFANIGGYKSWGDTTLSLELNLSEDEEERYTTPGISYRAMDDFEIGIGIAVGLTEEADDYQVIGKLLWEFGD